MSIIVIGSLAWASRGFWRDTIEEARKPDLPPAAAYTTPSPVTSTPAEVVIAKASSTKITPVAPLVQAPSSTLASLPTEVNLAIPFLSQAPKQNWDMPYQEACEEASMIMVDAYFAHRTKKFSSEEGDRVILDLVVFEEKRGLTPDITAVEAAGVISSYFSKRTARVVARPSVDDLRRLLADGHPVIIPADGKALKNPNFRNGGPRYHMLVLKGYLSDGRWIVNDPGTRKGADYLYDRDILWSAIRDWNGGDVKNAIPVVIVMEANK